MSHPRSRALSNPSPRPGNRSNPRSLQSNGFICEPFGDAISSLQVHARGGESFALELTDLKARADAMGRLKAGELTALDFDATTFIQRPTPNRNFVRFKPGMMPTFGASFSGQPFLVNHNRWEVSARGGTILTSKTVHQVDLDTKSISMTIQAVKAWAMEGVLDGTIDRFSIGWSRTGPVECSFHGASISKCDCWPGDKMEGGHVVEFVFTAAEGTEVSGVNVPAVVGTGIEAISGLAALDRDDLLCMLMDNEPPTESLDMLNPKIIAALALAATATDDDVLAAIAQRDDELKIAKERATTAEAELATHATAHATTLAAEQKKKTDATLTALKAAGKVKPGGEAENALRRMGGRDFALFEAQAKELLEHGPMVTPAGAKLAVLTDPVDPVVTPGLAELTENPHLQESLRKAGITLEQYQKHGASARSLLDQKRNAGY